jgi:hypothetical protein
MSNPYISITDFTHADQVRRMLGVLSSECTDRLLGVGVMMSYKTLNGLETKWSKAFPPKEKIREIFLPDAGLFNVLHYADYDGLSTADDLLHAVACAGPNLDAIQFDMIWPRAELLDALRRDLGVANRRPEFILQVGAKAIEAVWDSPTEVGLRIMEYQRRNLINRVLFDESGGRGRAMDAKRLLRFIHMVPAMNIVIAGGLGPDTVPLAEPVLRQVPDASLDAQGKLRPSGSALDPIDWDMAERYIRAACKLVELCADDA